MTIVRWDPFRDFGFTSPSTLDAAGGHFPDRRSRARAEGRAARHVARRDRHQHRELVLTVKGEKKASGEVKDEQYHHIERHYGSFSPHSRCRRPSTRPGLAIVQERRPHRAAAAA